MYRIRNTNPLLIDDNNEKEDYFHNKTILLSLIH